MGNINQQISLKTRPNILRCLEGYRNQLVFKNLTKKDLKTNESSLKMNYKIMLMSFSRGLNFYNIITWMNPNIKKYKIISLSMNMKKIISSQIQFFLDVFLRIKLLLVQKTKMFLSRINKTISSPRYLSRNSEHNFSTIIIIIKC